MKEDRGIVLDALRRQRRERTYEINELQVAGPHWPAADDWRDLVEARQQELARLDAEIARRTQPRKPSGRPKTPRATLQTLRDLIHQGTPKKHAAKQIGIARSTLYRLLATEEFREP